MTQKMIDRSKLDRLSEIKAQVNELYKEKMKLESEVISEMLSSNQGDSKVKEVALNDTEKLTLVYMVDKKIDYDKLKSLYPKIYEMGLQTSFSMGKALMAVEHSLLRDVIKDCTIETKGYQAKYEKTKYKKPTRKRATKNESDTN